MLALRWISRTLPALALSVVCAAAVAQPDAQPISECEVIARANSEVILACELDWQVRLMLEQKLGDRVTDELLRSPMVAAAREAVMKNLVLSRIEMALLYADFRSNAPQADLAAIYSQLDGPFESTEVPRLMESIGVADRAELEERLISLGTSLAERRQDFYRTMIARSWLQESVKINREVTHEQMLEYYYDHEEDYAQPDRVRWEELMVQTSKHGTKPDAYRALAQLGNEAFALANGTPAGEPAFGGIAKAKSDGFTAEEGGAYHWTTRGSLTSEEIDQALFTLPIGRMSPIIEGPSGFHIVRVIERKEAGPTPFREVQSQIREDLRNARFDAAISAKLTELKKSARLWTVYTGEIGYEELAELQGATQRR